MCPCDKETAYVCQHCRSAILRGARYIDGDGLRKRHGEWKCEAVLPVLSKAG